MATPVTMYSNAPFMVPFVFVLFNSDSIILLAVRSASWAACCKLSLWAAVSFISIIVASACRKAWFWAMAIVRRLL